jgi:hypothetical protein
MKESISWINHRLSDRRRTDKRYRNTIADEYKNVALFREICKHDLILSKAIFVTRQWKQLARRFEGRDHPAATWLNGNLGYLFTLRDSR